MTSQVASHRVILPASVEQTIQRFGRTVRNIFPIDLKSLVLFGSAVSGGFDPRRSDLNFLIVLEELHYEHIARVTPYVAGWRKNRIATPVLLDPAYMKNSLDTFPIEILEMSIKRRILLGDDPFDVLHASNDAVRRQCSRELKGMLMRHQRDLMQFGLDPRALSRVIQGSAARLVRVARYLVWLSVQELRIDPEPILAELGKAADTELRASRRAWRASRGLEEISKQDGPMLFKTYMLEIQKLAAYADHLGRSANS